MLEPPGASISNASFPGSCTREAVVEVELGLEIGSSVSGGGKVASSLMITRIGGNTRDEIGVGVGEMV